MLNEAMFLFYNVMGTFVFYIEVMFSAVVVMFYIVLAMLNCIFVKFYIVLDMFSVISDIFGIVLDIKLLNIIELLTYLNDVTVMFFFSLKPDKFGWFGNRIIA